MPSKAVRAEGLFGGEVGLGGGFAFPPHQVCCRCRSAEQDEDDDRAEAHHVIILSNKPTDVAVRGLKRGLKINPADYQLTIWVTFLIVSTGVL